MWKDAEREQGTFDGSWTLAYRTTMIIGEEGVVMRRRCVAVLMSVLVMGGLRTLVAEEMNAKERVKYLKASYGEVPMRAAQDVLAARIFGSAQAQVFSNFEEYKGFAYYSFTGTLPYVFDPLRYRDSVRAAALWETVAKPVAAAYWKLGGNVKEVDGVIIRIRTSSGNPRMPLSGVGANEVFSYIFTASQIGRFMAGEISVGELFERSQVQFNGTTMKIDYAADRDQIAALTRQIETFRLKTSS